MVVRLRQNLSTASWAESLRPFWRLEPWLIIQTPKGEMGGDAAEAETEKKNRLHLYPAQVQPHLPERKRTDKARASSSRELGSKSC